MTTPAQFHHHLDICERCRTRPFDLCAEGDRLLRTVATSVRARLGVDARTGAVEDDSEHPAGYGHGV